MDAVREDVEVAGVRVGGRRERSMTCCGDP